MGERKERGEGKKRGGGRVNLSLQNSAYAASSYRPTLDSGYDKSEFLSL